METPVIRHLESADLDDAARLLHTLNPDTPLALVRERLKTILTEHPHYELLGAFVNGRLAGLCGVWIATKIWCGRYLEIDNLVVDPELRDSGVGTALMKHIEQLGRERDCKILVLDCYTTNHASHRLYHRLGFNIWGFHFIKPIGNWSGKDGA